MSKCEQCLNYAEQIELIKKNYKIHYDSLNSDNNILKFQLETLINNSNEIVDYQSENFNLKHQIHVLLQTNENYAREMRQLFTTRNNARLVCASCSKSFKELQDKILQTKIVTDDITECVEPTNDKNMEAVYQKFIKLESTLERERKRSLTINDSYLKLIPVVENLKKENEELLVKVASLESVLSETENRSPRKKAKINNETDDVDHYSTKSKLDSKTKLKIKPKPTKISFSKDNEKTIIRCREILNEIPDLPMEKLEVIPNPINQMETLAQRVEEIVEQNKEINNVASVTMAVDLDSSQSKIGLEKTSIIDRDFTIIKFDIEDMLVTYDEDKRVSDIMGTTEQHRGGTEDVCPKETGVSEQITKKSTHPKRNITIEKVWQESDPGKGNEVNNSLRSNKKNDLVDQKLLREAPGDMELVHSSHLELDEMPLGGIDFSMDHIAEMGLPVAIDFNWCNTEIGNNLPLKTTKNIAHVEFLKATVKFSKQNISMYSKFCTFFNTQPMIPNIVNVNSNEPKRTLIIKRASPLKSLTVVKKQTTKTRKEINKKMADAIKRIFFKQSSMENEFAFCFSKSPPLEEIFDGFCGCFMRIINGKVVLDQTRKLLEVSEYIFPKLLLQCCERNRGLEIFQMRALESLLKVELLDVFCVRLELVLRVLWTMKDEDRLVAFITDVLLFTNIGVGVVVSSLDSVGCIDYAGAQHNWFITFLKLLLQFEYCVRQENWVEKISKVAFEFWLEGVSHNHARDICCLIKNCLISNRNGLNFFNRLFSIVKYRCVK